jgi:putative methylase
MNPPFGTKRKHLDKLFLGKALRMAPVVYSIHKSSTRDHILRYVERQGFSVRAIHEYKFEIPRMFEHHRKRRYEVRVDCYRMLAGRLSTKSAR